MEVPIARLIDRSQLAANVPAHARILVCHPRPHPDGERPAARILATARSAAVGESGAAGSDGGDSQGPPLEGNWLESDQPAALEELLRDVQAGNGGIRRMPFQGQDCQWVYAAARSGVFLLVIVPQEQILVPVRDAEAIIHDLVDRLIRYTTLVLAALLVGIVLLALRFSRSVTRPIQDLEQGAARLAAGDFDARVTIDSRDEFGDMGRIFNRVGPQLREHTRLRAALEVAREVQQNLMPRELPHVAGLQLAARVEYCDQTGGDYYDVIGPDASGGTYLAIGDASEHGVSAALLMATTRALLRQRIANGGDLADIVADVNRQLAADVDTTGRFVTLLVVRLDPQRGELRWVRAGHEPALIYAAARGTWEALQETGGPPLGVAEAARYRETVRRFAPGDILVMATDGLREVRDPSGAMLGRSALERIVQRLHAQDCATILTEVWETLHRFRGVRPLEDDITLMVVRPAALTPAPDAAGAAPPS
jgi:sigma-B regulation protein RsbU (phosphoserine phosphatase)